MNNKNYITNILKMFNTAQNSQTTQPYSNQLIEYHAITPIKKCFKKAILRVGIVNAYDTIFGNLHIHYYRSTDSCVGHVSRVYQPSNKPFEEWSYLGTADLAEFTILPHYMGPNFTPESRYLYLDFKNLNL